jgi:hypothetical protein
VSQVLNVPVAAKHGRLHLIDPFVAERFHAAADFLDARFSQLRITHHTPRHFGILGRFELRFDEKNHIRPCGQNFKNWRQNLRQRNETDIPHGHLRHRVENRTFEETGIHSFMTEHARIVPKSPIQQSLSHIDRVHEHRPPLQKAIGEPAGGGPDIEANPAIG